MQKILIAKYGKKVTREEAENISLQNCLEDFENGIIFSHSLQYLSWSKAQFKQFN